MPQLRGRTAARLDAHLTAGPGVVVHNRRRRAAGRRAHSSTAASCLPTARLWCGPARGQGVVSCVPLQKGCARHASSVGIRVLLQMRVHSCVAVWVLSSDANTRVARRHPSAVPVCISLSATRGAAQVGFVRTQLRSWKLYVSAATNIAHGQAVCVSNKRCDTSRQCRSKAELRFSFVLKDSRPRALDACLSKRAPAQLRATSRPPRNIASSFEPQKQRQRACACQSSQTIETSVQHGLARQPCFVISEPTAAVLCNTVQ